MLLIEVMESHYALFKVASNINFIKVFINFRKENLYVSSRHPSVNILIIKEDNLGD